MATLESVRFVPHFISIDERVVRYTKKQNLDSVVGMPQIYWADNTPWREANLWAVERLTSDGVSIKTVRSNMNGLLRYAKFLEANKIYWFQFPTRKAERCLVIYRGALIKLRDSGLISPATASEYMRACIMFYRWVKNKELISCRNSLWKDIPFMARYFDQFGFSRTIHGFTTDLKIPNRKRLGLVLESGLLPVSSVDRDEILDFVSVNGSRELYLMLVLGFFTGMRLGSICDLKLQTLVSAVSDPLAPGLLRMAIGPGAAPPVQTKLAVTGHVWIPLALRDELISYSTSWRRIEREERARPENTDLLFLTRFGNPYGRRGSDQSSAINVEMSSLRRKARSTSFTPLCKFRFHQTRCTFGTELARMALAVCSDAAIVVAMVSDALLHAKNSEAITFRYIRFVQTIPVRQALSHRFMAAFSGLHSKSSKDEKF